MNFVQQMFIICIMTIVHVRGQGPLSWLSELTDDCKWLCVQNEQPEEVAAFQQDILELPLFAGYGVKYTDCGNYAGCRASLSDKAVSTLKSTELFNDAPADGLPAKIGWCTEQLQNRCSKEVDDAFGTKTSDASTLYPAFIGLLSSMLAFILLI